MGHTLPNHSATSSTDSCTVSTQLLHHPTMSDKSDVSTTVIAVTPPTAVSLIFKVVCCLCLILSSQKGEPGPNGQVKLPPPKASSNRKEAASSNKISEAVCLFLLLVPVPGGLQPPPYHYPGYQKLRRARSTIL